MSDTTRRAFFVSDRTGITAETVGHTLLTQFETVPIVAESLRFIDSPQRANAAVDTINEAAEKTGVKPLVFSTLVEQSTRDVIKKSNCLYLDFFDAFIQPLEAELQVASSHTAGRSHGVTNYEEYSSRIEAVNFSLNHDDGSTITRLSDADVILVGISRTGKTPTCLYLSMHYGMRAANFPLTEDDLEEMALPASLREHKSKLFGLTTDPMRLQQIREERRPNSKYSSLGQCDYEIRQAEALFKKLRVPFLDTSQISIEEISTKIIEILNVERGKQPYR